MKNLIPSLVLAFVAATASSVTAQTTSKPPVEKPTPAQDTQRATAAQVPLRVQLVVSRYQGEKKVSSTPYTLSVVANDNDKTSLRMGVDVPVVQTVFGGGTAQIPQTSYTYRSVGTNIDCAARTIDGGVFKLDLAVSNSSLFVPEKQEGAVVSAAPGVPAIRSFTSTFNVLLKDGQAAQYTAATDAVSGEVLRVDVTLNVLK